MTHTMASGRQSWILWVCIAAALSVVALIAFQAANQRKTAIKERQMDIFDAVQKEDIERIKMILAREPNSVDRRHPWDQSTLLHAACSSIGNHEVVTLLVLAGASLDLRDDQGMRPVDVARKYHKQDTHLANLVDPEKKH